MKNTNRILTLALTLLPMLAAAQMQPNTRITARVPFNFVVGSEVIPAGLFTVQAAVPDASMLEMRNKDAMIEVFSNVNRPESKHPAPSNALVFHKYGHRYFLWEVRVEGSNVRYQLPQSRAEAELEAQTAQAPEEILLALK